MTKQILLSALILGATGNIVLAMEQKQQDEVFKNGWHNELNNTDLSLAILNPAVTELDDIKIIEKFSDELFHAMGTIGLFKKHPELFGGERKRTLQHINSNNAMRCGDDTILLDSTDTNNCDRLRNEFEQCKDFGFLTKKNNTTK